MIEAPKLVDKTLFLFFDFMLTIVVAAGSNFSKLQTKVDASSTMISLNSSYLAESMYLASRDQNWRSIWSFLATWWMLARMVLRTTSWWLR